MLFYVLAGFTVNECRTKNCKNCYTLDAVRI
jgi:hypothetical protein